MFSALKSILISFVLCVGCGGAGLRTAADHWAWEQPTAVSCGDVGTLADGAWVTLSDCEGVPQLAVVETRRSRRSLVKRVRSAELPLRAQGTDETPRLVLETRRAAVLGRMEEVLGALRDDAPSPQQLAFVAQPLSLGTLTARVRGSTPPELRRVLGATVVHVEEVEPTRPSLWSALLFIGVGALQGPALRRAAQGALRAEQPGGAVLYVGVRCEK